VESSAFVDTNILLYRLYKLDAVKQLAASRWTSALWDAQAGRVSWQVIVEFYSVAVSKYHVPAAIARAETEDLMEWNPETPGAPMISRAWHWCDHASINFWDAMIVAAAEQAGCRWLLSEDFQAGRKFASVTVVNPFERDPSEFGFV
jgi:predicted nucleic acid-binding protein